MTDGWLPVPKSGAIKCFGEVGRESEKTAGWPNGLRHEGLGRSGWIDGKEN